MGLTIHYSLSLPRRFSREKAAAMIGALRQRCLDLPFESVGESVSLSKDSGDDMDIERFRRGGTPMPEKDRVQLDLLFGATGSVQWTFARKSNKAYGAGLANRDFSRFKIKAIPKDTPHDAAFPYGRNEQLVPPLHALGFDCIVGPGCESFGVGLALLPPTVSVQGQTLKVPAKGWAWRSFCKTQYANDPRRGGLQNFLRCHLCVVAALDAAKEIGFTVEVSDEGG